MPSSKKNWPRAIATTTDNRKWKHRRFGLELAISGSRSMTKSFGYPLPLHRRKSRICRWNYDAICHSSRDITTSGFGGHIDTSGCRSLLYSLVNTIFHLYGVFNPRFFVRILTVPFIVSEIYVFPVSVAILNCRSSLETPRYASCEFAMVEYRRFTDGILI